MTASLPNESSLLGAIENYMHSMVHVKPFLAEDYRAVLEDMAEQWLANGGANQLQSVEASWLEGYISQAENETEQRTRRQAIDEFLHWSTREGVAALG
jgi:hypothetical protein